RKTWESIGRPLPGRTSIVVTGNSSYHADGAKVVYSVQQAVRVAQALAEIDATSEAFVIGGAALYAAAMPVASRFHLTRVHAEVEGDTVLTGFHEEEWHETSRQDFSHNEANPYDYSICILDK
ncbi:MAG: dihydrofolate reductase, partial [Pseudomonadota bacterium]|nr:dihydrofolate reductase [Pseudomonadota bacterium]